MSHNIKLKDNQGNDVTYSNVSEINLLDTDGNEVVFGEKKTEQTKTITPTTSEQVVTADNGYELSQVKVEAIQTEEKTVTKNGEYTPSEGKYFSNVTVSVSEPVLISKNITEKGTYNSTEDNVDGYSNVTVNVQPELQQKTVVPTESDQEITPDDDYDGVIKVYVEAI